MGVVRVAYTLEQCWHRVPGGTAVAAIEVARALSAARPDVELIGVSGRHEADSPVTFDITIDVASLAASGPLLYEASLRFGRPRVERVTGPIDLVHATTIVPFGTTRPLVTTIHDLAFLRHPEFFTRRGRSVFRRSLRTVRRRSRMVLCSSQATWDDCAEAGIPTERLRLVHLGVRAATADDADVRRVRERYGLPTEYLLFVGTLEPRKNLAALTAALATRTDLPPLVVAGASGWGDSGVADRDEVRLLGHVPDHLLGGLYRGAACLVYPSLWEGFGFPVLEAMAHGTPVVTSSGTSTEEVAGGAAVLVDPRDGDSILAGIERALDERDELVPAGLARAAEMTWERAALATAAVYDEVLAS
jgi:glycosyltransferase involved in cell wall biosynthesis